MIMRKRVQIALAVLLVAIVGGIAWRAAAAGAGLPRTTVDVWITEGMSRGPRILALSEIDVRHQAKRLRNIGAFCLSNDMRPVQVTKCRAHYERYNAQRR